MNNKTALIEAFEASDQLAVKRLGWWEIWDACATWWRPRQTATAKDMVPYAKALGNEKPGDILADLNSKTPTVNAGRNASPLAQLIARTTTPAALHATTAAIANGEQPCECGCPAARDWRIDDHGVQRCAD